LGRVPDAERELLAFADGPGRTTSECAEAGLRVLSYGTVEAMRHVLGSCHTDPVAEGKFNAILAGKERLLARVEVLLPRLEALAGSDSRS
jgi:hypothetical protein